MNKEQMMTEIRKIQSTYGINPEFIEQHEAKLELLEKTPELKEIMQSGVPEESIVVVDSHD